MSFIVHLVEVLPFVIFICVFFCVVFVLPVYTPRLIRSHRLRQIAKLYGLKYQKQASGFSFLSKEKEYLNSLEGNINGVQIAVRDEFGKSGFRAPVGKGFSHFGKRATTITINGKRNKIKGGMVGYAPVSLIEDSLRSIKERTELEYLVETDSSSFNVFIMLWILVISFGVIIYIFANPS